MHKQSGKDLRKRCAETISNILPFFLRKHKSFNLSGLLPRQQIVLLSLISKDPLKPAGFYGEQICVPKSSITVLSNSLVTGGYVTREFDPKDRRIILLDITEKGRAMIKSHRDFAFNSIIQDLEHYDEKDVERMESLLIELKEIFDKYN